MGNEIKDELIPLALEYFLNIMDLTPANNEDEEEDDE